MRELGKVLRADDRLVERSDLSTALAEHLRHHRGGIEAAVRYRIDWPEPVPSSGRRCQPAGFRPSATAAPARPAPRNRRPRSARSGLSTADRRYQPHHTCCASEDLAEWMMCETRRRGSTRDHTITTTLLAAANSPHHTCSPSTQTKTTNPPSRPSNPPRVPEQGSSSAIQTVRRVVWVAAHIGHHMRSPTTHPFVSEATPWARPATAAAKVCSHRSHRNAQPRLPVDHTKV